jgi:26S proteasome regulatory subunit N8
VVHPLVLLSVADHHARSVARGSSKRVVGVLLGQDHGKSINAGKSINVANSFGVPFEEDDKDAKTWFLDHNYVEGMFEMFKKVNGAWRVPSVLCVQLRVPHNNPVVVIAAFQLGNA